MSQVDEGLIHAWLDGQLSPDEAARVERLVATDAAWSAAVADARGVTAGASRILGALDDVPSVRSAGSIGGATRPRRSVLREPWFRAAAGIVLVVGVGSVLMKQMPAGDALTTKDAPAAKNELTRLDSSGRQQGAKPVVALPGVAAVPPASAELRPNGFREQAPAEGAKRNAPVAPKTAPRQDAMRGGGMAQGSAAGSGAASDVVSGGVTANAAPRPIVTADSGRVNALALQKPARLALPTVPAGAAGSASASGGRGGRPVVNAAAEMRDQTSTAKSLDATQMIDPRLSGCWLTIDTVPSRVYVLKFVDPVVTDVLRAASAPPAPQSTLAPQARGRALARSPAGVRLENTSPRKFGADSSFRAEWITGNGRTTLIFTVHGDSIAGNTILAAGDVRYPPSPLRASRVQCPP